MTHDEARDRLPDLLHDRDDPLLLAHVNACHACQQQLFRLSRVDRILRANGTRVTRRRLSRRWFGVAVAAVAAAVIILVGLARGHQPPGQVLRSATGTAVGQATLSKPDAQNLTVSLELRGIKMTSGDVYVLWTRSTESPRPVPVGRFMVDASGSCNAHFTLPSRSQWKRFWITPPSHPSLVLATT